MIHNYISTPPPPPPQKKKKKRKENNNKIIKDEMKNVMEYCVRQNVMAYNVHERYIAVNCPVSITMTAIALVLTGRQEAIDSAQPDGQLTDT